MLYNLRSRKFHKTLNGENPSSDMLAVKSGISPRSAGPEQHDNTPPAGRAEGLNGLVLSDYTSTDKQDIQCQLLVGIWWNAKEIIYKSMEL